MIQYEQIPDENGVGLQRNGITWLASWPKSGNTWVRLFLAAYLNGPENFSIQKRNFSGDVQLYHYQSVSPVPTTMLSDFEIWRLRDAALAHQYFCSTKTNLILKTHSANASIRRRWLIPQDLTHKSVYIVRDPRDVLVSWRRYAETSWSHAYRTLTDEGSILQSEESAALPTFMSSWGRHVLSWTSDKALQPAVISYESLVANPGKGFRALLSYLEIEIDEDRLAESIELTSIDSLRQIENDNRFLENLSGESFFHKGGSRWKDELPPEYADKIEQEFGDLMKQLDYI